MKKISYRNKYLVAVLISIAILSNCALTAKLQSRVNLVKEGIVTVEKTSPQSVSISNVFVYQEKDLLNLSGQARLRNRLLSGHFDIAILDADKNTMFNSSVVAHRIRRKKSSRTGPRFVKFNTTFPIILPTGSTVKVAFHKDTFTGVNTFDCGNNVVLNE